MTIIKCLDLSTAHVPANFEQLTIPFRRIEHEYGWVLFLTTELEKEELKQLKKFKFLHEIYKLAIKKKCGMVNFDRDGEQLKTLENFDW